MKSYLQHTSPHLLTTSSQRRARNPATEPHIAVIGAGLAGLRCADVLLNHGFKVTLIEGRDRVGGRLHQEKLPNGFTVDLGPNWIHGGSQDSSPDDAANHKDNPIMHLATQTDTTVGSWDTASYIFNESGDFMEEGEKHSDLMWDIVQDAFRHSNKLSSEISEKESLHDFFRSKVVEKIPDTEEGYERKREIVLQMSDMWGAFVGSPIARQSLKFFWLEECIEGGEST